MATHILHEPETWRGLIETLGRWRPEALPRLGFDGQWSRWTQGGSLDRGGQRGVPMDEHEALRAAMGALAAVGDALPEPVRTETSFTVRASVPDGRVVVVSDSHGRLEFGFDQSIGAVVLDPEARPAYYRLIEPRPDATVSACADVASMLASIEGHVVGATGASSDTVAAAEARLGTPFTDELRALYAVADGGYLRVLEGPDDPEDDEDHSDDDMYASWLLNLIPLNPDDPRRRRFTYPYPPMDSWRAGADKVVADDQGGRIQPTGGSPWWFPFAHDGGGSFWAIDLAPGPNGHRGQVIFLDRNEGLLGARVVSDSLTEHIVARRSYPRAERRDDDPRHWLVLPRGQGRHGGTVAADLSDVDLDRVEILWITGEVSSVDLGALAGRSALRTIHLRALPADPRQLLDLPGLQYLSADLPVWQSLLDAGAVPPGLAAVGFHDDAKGREEQQAFIAAAIVAAHGGPPLTATALVVSPRAR